MCDPWAGTATTGVSALQLGRKFIGFDVCQEYIEIGKRRLETVLKEKDKA